MVDITSLIISVISLLLSIIIGIYIIKDKYVNSFPRIQIAIKYHKNDYYEFSITNIGRCTAYDFYLFISTGWGKTEPDRISFKKIRPNQNKIENVKFPQFKQGGVNTISTLVRCKRTILFFIKKEVEEQKQTFDNIEIKYLTKYDPKVKLGNSRR